MIHSTDEKVPISSKSVFRIAKSLENAVGPDYNVKKLSSGDLLIEVFKKTQSDQLEKLEMVADQTVTVTPYRSLNSTQGVISERDLINETDEDILENLRPQVVTAVRRITIRRSYETIRTKHIVLTFNRSSLPDKITVAFISCPVRAYVPNPRRCFKCQRYGHGSQSCRGKLTCAKCGENEHSSDNCEKNVLMCTNCNGSHAAYSRQCPIFKKEK